VIKTRVYDRVRTIRIAQGWTQKELADRIGVTHGTISMVEAGRRPSVRLAKRFERVLGVDWTEFFADLEND
jgi:transcriptional regulator with XRE-family HTH domain